MRRLRLTVQNTDGRVKTYSEDCKKKAKAPYTAKYLAAKRTEKNAKIDRQDQEARELERRAQPPAPVVQTYRREPSSMPQSAPRIKRRIHLPPAGQYAPVGSPEAAAAIERVKAESVGGSDDTDYPPF